MTKAEATPHLRSIRSKIDYKEGDWVETCVLLPGIVEHVDVRYNAEGECINDVVEIFYPHLAVSNTWYHGGSLCSANNCGIHKITPQYAMKLLSLGEIRLKTLWHRNIKDGIPWHEAVEAEYKRVFG